MDMGRETAAPRRASISKARRLFYVTLCSTSSVVILWALIHMAISEPLYALAAAVGALLIVMSRLDILLGTVYRDAARHTAQNAHTRNV